MQNIVVVAGLVRMAWNHILSDLSSNVQHGSHLVTVLHSSEYGLPLSYALIQCHSVGFPSGAWDMYNSPSVPYTC